MCAVVLYSYDGNNIYSGKSILGIHYYITQIEAHLLREYEHCPGLSRSKTKLTELCTKLEQDTYVVFLRKKF